MIGVSISKQSPDWSNYGLYSTINAGTEWKRYSVPFEAAETVGDARIQFFFGEAEGVAWLDDVQLTEAPPAIYRRDFTNGIALLNGSMERQTVQVGPGFKRLNGTQAAKYEYIVDDAGTSSFTAGAGWTRRRTTAECGRRRARTSITGGRGAVGARAQAARPPASISRFARTTPIPSPPGGRQRPPPRVSAAARSLRWLRAARLSLRHRPTRRAKGINGTPCSPWR